MNTEQTLAEEMQGELDRLLASYSSYYNIDREPAIADFAAVAEFHLHDEQYFLVRAARLSEADVHEYVYFALADTLDGESLGRLCDLAWEEGLSRAEPKTNHRSTDVGLVILARHIPPETAAVIKKCRRSKSYKFGLWGYSHFRLVAYDLTRGAAVRNPMGDAHEKAVINIFKGAVRKQD